MTETIAPALPNYSAGTWTVDPVHSTIGFTVRHAMVSKVRGKFTNYTASFVTADSILDSTVTASIDVSTIDTGNEMRDNHIRSADFFDAENHPTMTFASTGIRYEDGGYLIDGDLTIRGVSRAITLTVEEANFGPGMDGSPAAGFTATTEIQRSEFGVSYNGPIPGGGTVISEKVQIVLEVEANLQK